MKEYEARLTAYSNGNIDLLREDYNKQLFGLEQEKEAIDKEKQKYKIKKEKLKQDKKNFRSTSEKNMDQNCMADLEHIKSEIEVESLRLQKQEMKIKKILDKLQSEKQKLKQDKQKLQKRKESMKRREDSIQLEQKKVEQEKQFLQHEQDELQLLKDQINNEKIKLNQEQSKVNAARNILVVQQKKVNSSRFYQRQNSVTDIQSQTKFNTVNDNDISLSENTESKEQLEQEWKEIAQVRQTLQEKQRIIEQNARQLTLEKKNFEKQREQFITEQSEQIQLSEDYQCDTQTNSQYQEIQKSLSMQCRTVQTKCPKSPLTLRNQQEHNRLNRKLNYSQE